ncbi:hypothetical protein ACJ41O_006335 [Fusarium nematophilum]
MVSKHVYDLCQATETVSSVLAEDPTQAPGDIVNRLYGNHGTQPPQDESDTDITTSSNDSLDTVLQCGSWGPTKPSPLFLQAFSDALKCLDADPTSGVVSPPLMGSHGTAPLTVIAPLADVVRHLSNLIVRAEKEVLFITCTWSPSLAQQLVKSALIELSRRAGSRGQRVVVKIMYDKPSLANVLGPHQHIEPQVYTSGPIQLPDPEDVPHLDLEVASLHKFVLGTQHAKFCIVDRKIAAVMSNNMEDNDNMEMMVHVEGPIVDSIYDAALITWNDAFQPGLPSHDAPATAGGLSTPDEDPHLLGYGKEEVAKDGDRLPEHTPQDPHYDRDICGETRRMQSCYSAEPHETRLEAANRQLNQTVKTPVESTGPQIQDGEEMTPYICTTTAQPVPMALVSRPAYGCIDSKSVQVPQNEAWLSLVRNAKQSIFIQTPDLNAAPLIPALAEAIKRGVEVTYYVCFGYNDCGEMIPGQGGTNDQVAQALVASLGPERHLLRIYNYVGKDQDHPIHHTFKSRSCHVKLLIVDGRVGVQGSGNQDTQSWYHSQEVNIMVDSREICEKWREAIERNQNTRVFGRVAENGVWRDAQGNPGNGYTGNPGPVEGLIKGVAGMAIKIKGAS